MKQRNILLAYLHLTLLHSLTCALPLQHLVIFDPNDESLAPRETIAATQLQVSPRAVGRGHYVLKEEALNSRQQGREMILAEEDETKEKSENMQLTNDDNNDNEKLTNDAADEMANKIENAESTENVVSDVPKPNVMENAIDTEATSGPIYITIPIYVNAKPGLPVTLAIGNKRIPLTAVEQGILSRQHALEAAEEREDGSPTSQYNKLL